MADFGNILQYQGRRFDVSAFRGAKRVGRVKLDQSFFGTDSSGEVVTGVQKLGQRFAIEFLTVKGSLLYLPLRGTDFITAARRGTLRTEQDAITAFNFAMLDIRQNMIAEEDAFTIIPMEDDERLGTVELINLTLFGTFMQLTVNVISLAGDSREVILPIQTTPIDVTV